MNFRKADMTDFTTKKITEYLKGIEHRRFANIDEINNQLAVQNGIYKVNLVEEKGQKDHIEDDYLIGQIGYVINQVTGSKYIANIDIQIWFIKDNYGNMYITETTVLEVVDEEIIDR